MNISTDLIIIGDGVIGNAIAAELLKTKINVVVIGRTPKCDREKASAAAGAMLGALGEVTIDDQGERAAIELDYRVRCSKLYPQFIEDINDATGVNINVTRGTVVVGNAEGHLDYENLQAITTAARSFGESAEWINWREVIGLRPAREMRPLGCVWLPNELGIDGSVFLTALSDRVQRGATIVAKEACAVNRQGSVWQVALDDGAIITGSKVIVTAGARAAEVLGTERWKALKLPQIFFGKGVSCVVQYQNVVCSNVIRTPNRAFACGIHLVPRSGNNMYIGATNFFGEHFDEEAGAEVGEIHSLFEQVIHQIDVNIRRAKIKEIRYGFRPILTTREPVVGETEESGLYVATGTYRNGILMAPLIARHIAHEVINGTPSLDNPYSPRTSMQKSRTVDLNSIVETGLRDLAEILREPGGHLPYNRSEELAVLLRNLWTLAFEDSPALSAFRAKVKQRLEEVPLTETINRQLYEILESGLARPGEDNKKQPRGELLRDSYVSPSLGGAHERTK
jgi:glycine oxidase